MTNWKIAFLPGLALLALSVIAFAAELVRFGYDWDIDHMMYFGGRLLAGELQWTAEFDDKLPVVQLLFTLPAWAGSIRVWQIMSGLSVIAGCTATYLFLVAAIQEGWPELFPDMARPLAFTAAATVAVAYAFLPGGLSHINPMAANMTMLSVALADAGRRAIPQARIWAAGLFLLAAVCASVAIGIRPYFFFPLVLIGIWAALKARVATVYVLVWGIVWVGCVGVSGILVNAVPYFVVGRPEALLAGFDMLGQKLNPEGPVSILERQIDALSHVSKLGLLAFAGWGAAVALVLAGPSGRYWSRSAILDTGYLVVLCPLLLEATILMKHFWPHYLQLFVPFLGLGIGFLGADLASRGVFRLSGGSTLALVLGSLVVIGVASKSEIGAAATAFVQAPSAKHSQAEQLSAFRRYLATRPKDERDFLNPSHMYFHWRLGETRHGFPHAANSRQILRNWWRTVDVPAALHLPTDSKQYCEMLKAKGPSVVVLFEGKKGINSWLELMTCSGYGKVDAVQGLLIFERVSDRGK